jgi:hypothetical protein
MQKERPVRKITTIVDKMISLLVRLGVVLSRASKRMAQKSRITLPVLKYKPTLRKYTKKQ